LVVLFAKQASNQDPDPAPEELGMSSAPTPTFVVPTDLAASIRAGKVSLFIGSGVSASAGLIGWADLIREMTDIIGKEDTTHTRQEIDDYLRDADYLDVAELFRQVVGPNAYFRFLRERYRREVQPSRLLKAIAKLNVRTIFTTNYDKLLELSFRRTAKADPPVIIYPDQLNYIEQDEIRIIKIHGDIDHPSSIVLTREDYTGYAARHHEFVQMLQSSINGSTMLFVGFGLRDPNFRRIYDDARSFVESTNRQAYALMTGTSKIQREAWRDQGLTILSMSNHNRLPSIIDQIRSA
jgi:NAD-dependent SIR2 family protein deacetylase